MAPARRSNPVLAPEEQFWRPFPFLKEQTKINSSVRSGNKTVTWNISNNFCFTLFNIIFLDLTKTGAKTAPRVQLGYFDGRVPKVITRATLATSGAGVVCHICITTINYLLFFIYLLIMTNYVHLLKYWGRGWQKETNPLKKKPIK